MTQRVLLVRHGRSSHVASPGWIDADGVARWRLAYNEAGILDDSTPPAALFAEVREVDCVWSSDLPRAVASAERLATGRPVRTSALFREMELEIPSWLPSRWPLVVWEACIHLQWLLSERRGWIAVPPEIERASEAVALLETVVRDEPSVVVVTHGAFRRLLGMRLAAVGWTAEPRVGGFRNWSVWPFRRGA